MPFDVLSLQDRTRALIASLYEKRHGPVPGAILMPALASDIHQEDDDLDVKSLLRSLGFGSFGAFVQQIPEISFERRPGSDFLVAPAGSAKLTKAFARPAMRIRRDFWRAFIEFPKQGTVRIYDLHNDKVLYLPVDSPIEGPRITPVPEGTQLSWRRQFLESESEPLKMSLAPALKEGGKDAFNEFARFIRENFEWSRAWNRYHQSQLSDWIAKWAADNGINSLSLQLSADPLSNTSAAPVSKRVELYNVLDRISIDDLMNLKVPLSWLLASNRER